MSLKSRITQCLIIPVLITLFGCSAMNLIGSDNFDPYTDTDTFSGNRSPALFSQSGSRAETGDDWDEDESPNRALSPEQRKIQWALETHDLVLGMQMRDVRSVWGRPNEIDTAGNAENGNQRWIYQESLATRYALNPNRKRIVYFERGRVVGWDTAGY